MKKVVFLVSILLLTLSYGQVAGAWTGNLNVFLGAKSLDEDDWEPLEDQAEFGVQLDFREKNWPFSIAIDVLHSEDDEDNAYDPFSGVFVDLKGETTEIDVGLRKIWELGRTMRTYLGGGAAFINARIEAEALGVDEDDDDDGIGFWLGGGIYWTLARNFNIGLDLRYSNAEVTLFGTDVNAGGGHAGLLLGYHW